MDRAGLEEVLRPFGESRMLPRAAYVEAAVFSWEQRVLFGGGWVCVALASQVLSPGSQWASSLGVGSVLLVRGEDGVLRAFANTCRHRGHELLPCGLGARAPMIICPYHGWTYTLSGELRAAGSFKAVRGFDFGSWGLRALPVTEWHGLVFVDASGGFAVSLSEALGKLDEIVAPYEPERLVTAGRHAYEVAANWKILTENYHECYHCPSIHPELCRVSPPKSGVNYAADGAWMGGWMALRDGMATMSLSGASGGAPLRGLSPEERRTVIYVNILPNVLLSLHPDYVMTHRLIPLAVDQTRIECTWAFAPEAVALPGFDPSYAVEFWDLTNRQDWAACESVQRGLASPHAVPGPLAPEEDAVYSFVTTIARVYLGQIPWAG
jgi:phenylpropionate dioxygenase-like ring-hydroxylating dioxygenase large terminal subunit